MTTKKTAATPAAEHKCVITGEPTRSTVNVRVGRVECVTEDDMDTFDIVEPEAETVYAVLPVADERRHWLENCYVNVELIIDADAVAFKPE